MHCENHNELNSVNEDRVRKDCPGTRYFVAGLLGSLLPLFLRFMYLQKLHLLNFKNWASANFEFSPNINCMVGANGSGKTNMLDAIHYLSMTKSYFGAQDALNIQDEQEFFVIEGQFTRHDETERLYCGVKKGQRKILKRNKKEYDRLADHIGQFPTVVISPYDRDLITEGSELRRRWMDSVISQGNSQYLFHLMRYTKAVQQRNTLLKYFAANGRFDRESLAAYDAQLLEHGLPLFAERQKLVAELEPKITHYHHWLSGGREAVQVRYKSALRDADFETLLQQNIAKDRQLQYTSVGLHKDNLEFTIGDKPMKRSASQGQQKSFLIALKLAQYNFLRAHQKVNPILLLDDIFDKLDEQRVEQLLEMVADANFGQIFITDTHAERTGALVRKIDPEARIFNTDENVKAQEKQQPDGEVPKGVITDLENPKSQADA